MGNAIARTHAAIEAWCAEGGDLVVGGHLVFLTRDKVFSWSPMLEFRDSMARFGFPFPLFCAGLPVAGRFGGGMAARRNAA